MGFIERGERESLADHLIRNASGLSLTSEQVSRLRRAARLDRPGATWKERIEAGNIADEVQSELDADFAAVVTVLKSRREGSAPFNQAGAVRVSNRDGLGSLHTAAKITNSEFADGMAFRLLFEARFVGLGSQLADFDRVRAGGLPGANALKRAYLTMRLGQIEDRVMAHDPSGRSLWELRQIAGDGVALRCVAPQGGNASIAALKRLKLTLAVVDAGLKEPLRRACESRPA